MKRSAPSSKQRRLENLILVLDENLSSQRILDTLSRLGIPVRSQMSFVARGATDPELIEALSGLDNVCLVTRDEDFRYKAGTVAVLKNSRIGVFVLTGGGNKNADELATAIARSWGAIQRLRRKHEPPFTARISPDGKASLHC